MDLNAAQMLNTQECCLWISSSE